MLFFKVGCQRSSWLDGGELIKIPSLWFFLFNYLRKENVLLLACGIPFSVSCPLETGPRSACMILHPYFLSVSPFTGCLLPLSYVNLYILILVDIAYSQCGPLSRGCYIFHHMVVYSICWWFLQPHIWKTWYWHIWYVTFGIAGFYFPFCLL